MTSTVTACNCNRGIYIARFADPTVRLEQSQAETELQATNRVPRRRIGELPSDMKVSCELSRYCTWTSSRGPAAAETPERGDGWRVVTLTIIKTHKFDDVSVTWRVWAATKAHTVLWSRVTRTSLLRKFRQTPAAATFTGCLGVFPCDRVLVFAAKYVGRGIRTLPPH